jgi:citrate synthase
MFSRGERVPGFFRDVYPSGDPRAALLFSDPLVVRAPVLRSVDQLVAAHATVTDADTPPSVDFALVAVCRVLALPRGSATALFAVGRLAGWAAHVLEQRQSAQVLRPRARQPLAATSASRGTVERPIEKPSIPW